MGALLKCFWGVRSRAMAGDSMVCLRTPFVGVFLNGLAPRLDGVLPRDIASSSSNSSELSESLRLKLRGVPSTP